MYDKVSLWLPRLSTDADITRRLERAQEIADLETGEVIAKGYLRGLRVVSNAAGYSIRGSLAKFAYNTNALTLDREATKEAIQMLSDELGLNIGAAKVTGLEFGTQFPMLKSVGVYLPKLGACSRLQRVQATAGTIYYFSNAKDLVFYDKGAEARVKKMLLPVGLDGANLLRFEMRLKRRLPQQIKVPEVTASILASDDCYSKLLKLWASNYFSIQKLKQMKVDAISGIKTPKDALKVLVARLLNNSDPNQIEAFLTEIKGAGVFANRNDYSRLKRKLKELAGNGGVTATDEDIRELDDAIKNAVAYH